MAAVAAGGRRVQGRGAAARRRPGAGEPPAFPVGRPPSSGRGAAGCAAGLGESAGRRGRVFESRLSGAGCAPPMSSCPSRRGSHPVAGTTSGLCHQRGAEVRAQTVPPAKKTLALTPLLQIGRGFPGSALKYWAGTSRCRANSPF